MKAVNPSQKTVLEGNNQPPSTYQTGQRGMRGLRETSVHIDENGGEQSDLLDGKFGFAAMNATWVKWAQVEPQMNAHSIVTVSPLHT